MPDFDAECQTFASELNAAQEKPWSIEIADNRGSFYWSESELRWNHEDKRVKVAVYWDETQKWVVRPL